MNLVFRSEAVLDLRKISQFTRKTYGKAQARRYIGQIEQTCGALAAGHYRGGPPTRYRPVFASK